MHIFELENDITHSEHRSPSYLFSEEEDVDAVRMP